MTGFRDDGIVQVNEAQVEDQMAAVELPGCRHSTARHCFALPAPAACHNTAVAGQVDAERQR
jgi:hypothetical protein